MLKHLASDKLKDYEMKCSVFIRQRYEVREKKQRCMKKNGKKILSLKINAISLQTHRRLVFTH